MELVLSEFAKANKFMSTIPIDELCASYSKLFPMESNGLYLINMERLNRLIGSFLDQTSMELVDKGLLEMCVGESGEIGFKITSLGKKVYEARSKRKKS